MANQLGLSQTNARRYYYGVHHVNGIAVQWEKGYTQVRKGACVTVWQVAQGDHGSPFRPCRITESTTTDPDHAKLYQGQRQTRQANPDL